MRKYLKEPDKLFRKVKDQHGNLVLSQKAKAYHPGRGVYRSSYKNARRLAVTEINIAYRKADFLRYQKLDFIVGIEIVLSGNHTLNGEPFHDICDELAGKYPKDFLFTGWHPFCRCSTKPIFKTDDEIARDEQKILRGEPIDRNSKNQIDKTPKAFNQWLKNNAERIEKAHAKNTLPYFLRDNQKLIEKQWQPLDSNTTSKPNTLEIAAQRHAQRTPEQIQTIQQQWNERQQKHALIRKAANDILNEAKNYSEVDYSALQNVIEKGDLNRMKTLTTEVEKALLEMKKQEQALASLIPNAHSLHKAYSMSALKDAYKELDGVMKRWLSKYGYSSLDNAPLEHLKNKWDFELNNPTISYSQKEIIKKAITEQIQLINKKIEWNNLLSKATSLQAFKTKSTIYKGYLNKIADAIHNNDFAALQKSIADAEAQQQKLINKQIKPGGDTKTALNQEYKGGAIGKDISASIDVSKMVSEDPYGGTFTNNVARLQGFDAPAKLVSEAEFEVLEKACGDVFYRTVNPTNFKGKKMTSEEFAAQLYTADKLELNGSGGRSYGDGIYVATSAWDGMNKKIRPLSDNCKRIAYFSSICYGGRNRAVLEMTWTRKPRIIKQSDLKAMWKALPYDKKMKFGGDDFKVYSNTYACALGYDAMYCDESYYMVIWNRSIIAVKKK